MSSKQQFHPENLRRRFHALGRKKAAIHAVSDPLRAERDALIQATEVRVKALNAKIKAAEQGLFDIDQERSMWVKALGRQTGKPEDYPAQPGE
jgi:hypothetical protein